MKQSKRVAVIGGGPGGLTLASILCRNGVPATVFERDEHESARPQGGSLDLHDDSGQHALRVAGLEAQFRAVARYEDQGMRILDERAEVWLDHPGSVATNRPEVDRAHLREILLRSLPPRAVQWGHKLLSVSPHAGHRTVTFANGRSSEFDLVVGADGTGSRVRPLVSGVKPVYTGVSFFERDLFDADVRWPQFSALIGHGMMFAIGNNKGLLAHRCANAHLDFYTALRVPEGSLDGFDLGRLVELFDDWSPQLRGMVAASSGEMIARGIYALPVGHRWQHCPGVTLLGDAAHVMSPFGGDGANLAMLDAADLALALTRTDDWDAAVGAYEGQMFERAAAAAEGAARGLAEAISPDGLSLMLKQIEAHGTVADPA